MNLVIEAEGLEGLSAALTTWFESLRMPVQEAMANRLQDIVQSNFGDGPGEDRPKPWQPLSPGYAKKAHGGDTTPREILSGELKDSIQVDASDPDQARVFTDMEYAAEQQWGGGEWNIPARPFFPIDETGILTPYTEAQIRQAAEEAIAEVDK